MRRAALALALPLPASADGGATVRLAEVSGLSPSQAEALLAALLETNVVASDCPGWGITDREWALVAGTADRLAREVLGLSADDYEARFYGPAFARLDEPETWDSEGPKIDGLIRLLTDLGGSPVPAP